MYKISEYGYSQSQIKNFTEYVADTFEELPQKAQFGDRGIFNENGTIQIAVYFSNGWVKGA